MQRVARVLLELPGMVTPSAHARCWLRTGQEKRRLAQPSSGSLTPAPLALHQLFELLYPYAPAPEAWWLQCIANVVRHPRPLCSYRCWKPAQAERCTVGGKRSLHVRFGLPLPHRTWHTGTVQVYWYAVKGTGWQQVPDANTRQWTEGGMLWVEAVVYATKELATEATRGVQQKTKVKPRTRGYKGRGDKDGNRGVGR